MYRVFFEDKFVDIEADEFEANYEFKKVSFINDKGIVVAVFNFNNILGFTKIQEGE